ncbi:hypothetical protein LR48_Vigan05g075000 [Vigna angularis]|uniref:Uncharacterized protein n=1 Tax=Phaseolus angularis TaxID=3914 RepID=A0A0L9UKD0_PHAAN|nr:hypothetical protein LR48_Vigan05g075000 [Vigna angularis]
MLDLGLKLGRLQVALRVLIALSGDRTDLKMRDMYMSLIDAQMQSIHRGKMATNEMIIGMYDTPQYISGPWMSFIMWWHGQRSKLRAVELEQLELQLCDDEDAFEDAEDVEDDEEEEDSDGSMG